MRSPSTCRAFRCADGRASGYPRIVDRPTLPSPPPGRSALPAFAAVERGLLDAIHREEALAARRVEEAEAEARRLVEESEQALKQRVIDAERRRVRQVEDAARDRISAARARVQAWIDASERRSAEAVDRALDVLTGGADASGGEA